MLAARISTRTPSPLQRSHCGTRQRNGEQQDTASSCQCHSHRVSEVGGCVSFKGKACVCVHPALPCGWAWPLLSPPCAGCILTLSSS